MAWTDLGCICDSCEIAGNRLAGEAAVSRWVGRADGKLAGLTLYEEAWLAFGAWEVCLEQGLWWLLRAPHSHGKNGKGRS